MLYDDYAIISLGSDIPKGEEPIKPRWLKVSFDMNNTNGTEFQEFASGDDIVTLKNCSNDKNNFQGISGRDSDFQINNSAFQQFLNVELIVND